MTLKVLLESRGGEAYRLATSGKLTNDSRRPLPVVDKPYPAHILLSLFFAQKNHVFNFPDVALSCTLERVVAHSRMSHDILPTSWKRWSGDGLDSD